VVNGQGRSLLIADPINSLGSSGFSYTVVTATPGGDLNSTSSIDDFTEQDIGSSFLSRIRAIRDTGDDIPSADERRLHTLWNVLFWSAISVVSVGVLHAGVVLFLRKVKHVDELPKMLHFPRLELIVFMIVLPMICAAGSACLLSSSSGTLAAGVCFGILLPFGFIIAASAFLIFIIVRPSLEHRRAFYVVCEAYNAGEALLVDTTTPGDLSSGSSNDSVASSSGKMDKSTIRHQDSNDIEVASGVDPSEGNDDVLAQKKLSGAQRLLTWVYVHIAAPLFGFESPYRANVKYDNVDASHPLWIGKNKGETEKVKQFGCFFEDAHGPQVFRVVTHFLTPGVHASEEIEEENEPRVFVSAEHSQTFVEILQTFGVIFALTKMMLFAAIINASGGVNNLAQVIALVVISCVHIAYLRFFVPYRLRIELAAEIVASTCDFAVFVCGIILISVNDWSTETGKRMGLAMLILQAIGFLVFITVRVSLAIRTSLLTVFAKKK
jgi:hypothetical protein